MNGGENSPDPSRGGMNFSKKESNDGSVASTFPNQMMMMNPMMQMQMMQMNGMQMNPMMGGMGMGMGNQEMMAMNGNGMGMMGMPMMAGLCQVTGNGMGEGNAMAMLPQGMNMMQMQMMRKRQLEAMGGGDHPSPPAAKRPNLNLDASDPIKIDYAALKRKEKKEKKLKKKLAKAMEAQQKEHDDDSASKASKSDGSKSKDGAASGPPSGANSPAPQDGDTVPPSKEGIKYYSRNDVLCGRGGGTNVHPGNRRFRDLINANRRAYLKARKNDKPAISRSIVKTIREMNGRFLKKDEKKNLWFEIGDDGAREKTSQALRQRAPEMRKILFEDEQKQRLKQQQEMMMAMGMGGSMGMGMNNMNMTGMGGLNNMGVDPNSMGGMDMAKFNMLQLQNQKRLSMQGIVGGGTMPSQRGAISFDNVNPSAALLQGGFKPVTPRGA